MRLTGVDYRQTQIGAIGPVLRAKFRVISGIINVHFQKKKRMAC